MISVDSDDAPTDSDLIGRVRDGDAACYAELYRRHSRAARAYASRLTPRVDPDDLVAESFVQVFDLLRRNAGPSTAFRAYLFTTIRNLHVRRSKRDKRLVVTDDEYTLDQPVQFNDVVEANFERSIAANAFRSLPDRWQLVLWQLDVERRGAAEIGADLGLSANGVSALAVRAREGLRQAYLREHLDHVQDRECRSVIDGLASYVRQNASKRSQGRIETHLPTCPRCDRAHRDIREVNSSIAALILPVLLATGWATTKLVPAAAAAGSSGAPSHLAAVDGARGIVGTVKGMAGVKAAVSAGAMGFTAVSLALIGLGPGGDAQAAVLPDLSAPRTVVSAPPASKPKPGSVTPSTEAKEQAKPVVVQTKAATDRPSGVVVRPSKPTPEPVKPSTNVKRPTEQAAKTKVDTDNDSHVVVPRPKPTETSDPDTQAEDRVVTPGVKKPEISTEVTVPTPAPADAVEVGSASLAQRGKSPVFDLTLRLRLADELSGASIVVHLPLGARSHPSSDWQCVGGVCRTEIGSAAPTSLKLTFKADRSGPVEVSGSVIGIKDGVRLDSVPFVAHADSKNAVTVDR
ncbi:sigma-70 family RNA polymerase sigma factor [Kribbella sp. NBC_01245]|uniref:sigma-70 family RNA polymerase sigma factor n=1 Tax=Kribbella sp. NBC_01245 TaxID=2903578 RepID=UPI002E2DBDE2|nr:sigma-70 family RNA polymerase sigma factor [Kribbella sp. NBC_01245]